jgi:hypothetical protein
MKKILSLIVLAASLTSGFAANYATNLLASGSHLVLSNTPIVLRSIQLYTTNTLASTVVKFYDGHIITTNTAYTNYTAARTAVVSTYITSTGTTNTLTNYVWKTSANAVAAGNVTRDPILTIVVPVVAGGPVNYPVDFTDAETASIPFSRFMIVNTDAAGIGFSLNYRTP